MWRHRVLLRVEGWLECAVLTSHLLFDPLETQFWRLKSNQV